MANSLTHTLPYPVRGAAYTVWLDFVDASGDPTDPTTPDTEVSKDGGAHADATEELTVVGEGSGYITLTAAEMTADVVDVICKGSGVRTAKARLFPRPQGVLATTTATGGSASQIVGPAELDQAGFTGCLVRTTSGTGAGQARVIVSETSGLGLPIWTVTPDWETAPDATTGIEILADLGRNADLSPVLAAIDTRASAAVLADVKNTTDFTIMGVSDLLSRLSSARAGYLDNLSAGAVALASAVQTLIDRLTATRAGYLDNLSAGAVAQQATVAAIQAKTDNLPASPAATGAQMDLVDVPNATARTAFADSLLTRDWTAIASWPARCALQAMRLLRNRWAFVAGTLTVYREDDTTSAWTAAATRQAADSVTEIDPA